MSPEQQRQPIIYLEGYDDWAICQVTDITVADEAFSNKEGETVHQGDVYLE